jgi:hypothetical protein
LHLSLETHYRSFVDIPGCCFGNHISSIPHREHLCLVRWHTRIKKCEGRTAECCLDDDILHICHYLYPYFLWYMPIPVICAYLSLVYAYASCMIYGFLNTWTMKWYLGYIYPRRNTSWLQHSLARRLEPPCHPSLDRFSFLPFPFFSLEITYPSVDYQSWLNPQRSILSIPQSHISVGLVYALFCFDQTFTVII